MTPRNEFHFEAEAKLYPAFYSILKILSLTFQPGEDPLKIN